MSVIFRITYFFFQYHIVTCMVRLVTYINFVYFCFKKKFIQVMFIYVLIVKIQCHASE